MQFTSLPEVGVAPATQRPNPLGPLWRVFVFIYGIILAMCAVALFFRVPWEVLLLVAGMATLVGVCIRPVLGVCLAFAVLPIGRGLSVGSGEWLVMSADRGIAVLLFLGVLAHMMSTRRRWFRLKGPPVWMLVALTALAALSITWAQPAWLASIGALTSLQMLIWIVLITTIILNEGSLLWPLRTFVVACVLVSTIAPSLGLTSAETARFTFELTVHGGVNPNSMANLFGLALFTAVYLFRTDPCRWIRWVWLGAAALMVLMILKTGSRSNIIALGVTLVLPIFLLREIIRKPAFLVVLLLVLTIGGIVVYEAVTYALLPKEVLSRLTSESYAEHSFGVRMSFITDAIDYTFRHPMGAGLSCFRSTVGQAVHNDLFYMLSNLGFLGAGSFLVFIGAMLLGVHRMKASWEKWYARSVLVFLLIAGLAGSYILAKHYWVFMAVAALMGSLQTKSPEPTAAPEAFPLAAKGPA